MDYVTLRKQTFYLGERLRQNPVVIRAYDGPGRSVFLRLKNKDKIEDLCMSLDAPNQGIRLCDCGVGIEKNSLIVRSMNRLIANSRLVEIGLAGKESEGRFDRVVKLHFVAIDSYFGSKRDFYVFCEFTGRVSDLFLCDSEKRILDRLSRTSNNLVGNIYQFIDGFLLKDVDEVSEKELSEFLLTFPVEGWQKKIGGLSPLVLKEVLYGTNGNILDNKLLITSRIRTILTKNSLSNIELSKNNKKISAYLYKKGSKVIAISAFELNCLMDSSNEGAEVDCIPFDSVNSAMNFVEEKICAPKRLEAEKNRVVSAFCKVLKQKRLLLEEQRELRARYEKGEFYQNIGNILIANFYRIKPGSLLLEAEDWTNGKTLSIKLDPEKTPVANAKKYFNLYKKSKRGILEVDKRIESLLRDIKWYEEQIWLAENAEEESWLNFEEKDKVGRLARKKESGKGSKKAKAVIKPDVEIGGARYYIGRNARQNDFLTFQLGKKGDVWFHANEVPGAHVLLKKVEGEITKEDLVFGARLAAVNSFARSSSKVLVDYTDVSNVRRAPNGGMGQVYYTNQRTLVVEPNDDRQLGNLPEG